MNEPFWTADLDWLKAKYRFQARWWLKTGYEYLIRVTPVPIQGFETYHRYVEVLDARRVQGERHADINTDDARPTRHAGP